MEINNAFSIGEMVFLKTDPDQFPRMITEIAVKMNYITYELSFIGSTSIHYEFEITKEKNTLLACGIEEKTNTN